MHVTLKVGVQKGVCSLPCAYTELFLGVPSSRFVVLFLFLITIFLKSVFGGGRVFPSSSCQQKSNKNV